MAASGDRALGAAILTSVTHLHKFGVAEEMLQMARASGQFFDFMESLDQLGANDVAALMLHILPDIPEARVQVLVESGRIHHTDRLDRLGETCEDTEAL